MFFSIYYSSIQIPRVNIRNIVQQSVLGSNGKLEFMCPADMVPEFGEFALMNALYIPGPKHMLDNVIGDMLQRMKHFDRWQGELKICCDFWLN